MMPRTAPAPAARGHRLLDLDHCLSGREPNNCRDQPRRPVVYRLQARQHVFQSLAFSPGLLPSPPVQSPRQGTSAAPRRKRKDCSPRPPRLSLFRAAADCRAGAVPPLPVRPDPKKKKSPRPLRFFTGKASPCLRLYAKPASSPVCPLHSRFELPPSLLSCVLSLSLCPPLAVVHQPLHFGAVRERPRGGDEAPSEGGGRLRVIGRLIHGQGDGPGRRGALPRRGRVAPRAPPPAASSSRAGAPWAASARP